MVKEHQGKGKALGRLKITDKDYNKIAGWIDDDAVTQEMYVEQLDGLLELGERSDKDALAATKLGDAGGDLMALWDKMDKGALKSDEALQQAEAVVRRKSSEGAVLMAWHGFSTRVFLQRELKTRVENPCHSKHGPFQIQRRTSRRA
jgi:hypothetical protein